MGSFFWVPQDIKFYVFFLLRIGSSKNESPPSTIFSKVCDPQRIQPKASPSCLSILKYIKIAPIANGYTPMPPLVAEIAKDPTAKAARSQSTTISL